MLSEILFVFISISTERENLLGSIENLNEDIIDYFINTVENYYSISGEDDKHNKSLEEEARNDIKANYQNIQKTIEEEIEKQKMIQKILDKEAEVKRLVEKNKELENHKNILEMKLAEQNSEAIQDVCDTLKHEKLLLESENKMLKSEIESLKKDFDLMCEEKGEIEERLQTKQEELINFREKLNSNNVEIKRSLKEQFEKEKSHLEVKVSQCEKKILDLTNKTKELDEFKRLDIKNKSIISELQKDIDKMMDKENELSEKITILKEECLVLKQKGIHREDQTEARTSLGDKPNSRRDVNDKSVFS